MLLDEHMSLGGEPGTGWDLREWRRSGLTHLGEQGASLLMLTAKSRHRKAENVRKYFGDGVGRGAPACSRLATADAEHGRVVSRRCTGAWLQLTCAHAAFP
nr:hypothetical protein [Streptomyces fulvoviolaceus]